MSWPGYNSPARLPQNSPDWPQRPGNPRNGHDFKGSPMKNYGWRNNGRYCNFQNDRFRFSPGNSRRGGGQFRGRGGGRRSNGDGADISLFVNPSMLNDPWKHLELALGNRMKSQTSLPSDSSITTTPNSSLTTSDNAPVPNNNEELTDELLISDSAE